MQLVSMDGVAVVAALIIGGLYFYGWAKKQHNEKEEDN